MRRIAARYDDPVVKVRSRVPAFAARIQRSVKILSIVVLVVVLTGAVIGIRDQIAATIGAVGLIIVLFNVLSLLIGYGAPRLVGVERREAVASSFEIGIHNATLAITVALSPALLNNSNIALPPAIYGTLMFFTAAVFGLLSARRGSVRPGVAGRGNSGVTRSDGG